MGIMPNEFGFFKDELFDVCRIGLGRGAPGPSAALHRLLGHAFSRCPASFPHAAECRLGAARRLFADLTSWLWPAHAVWCGGGDLTSQVTGPEQLCASMGRIVPLCFCAARGSSRGPTDYRRLSDGISTYFCRDACACLIRYHHRYYFTTYMCYQWWPRT